MICGVTAESFDISANFRPRGRRWRGGKSGLIVSNGKMMRLPIDQESYMGEFKKLISRTDSSPVNDRGFVSCATRYRHRQGGYKGMLYGEGRLYRRRLSGFAR